MIVIFILFICSILMLHGAPFAGAGILLIGSFGGMIIILAGVFWPNSSFHDYDVVAVVCGGWIITCISLVLIIPDETLLSIFSWNDSQIRSRYLIAVSQSSVIPSTIGGLTCAFTALLLRLSWRPEEHLLKEIPPHGHRFISQTAMILGSIFSIIFFMFLFILSFLSFELSFSILPKIVWWILPFLIAGSLGLLLPEIGFDERSRPEIWGWRFLLAASFPFIIFISPEKILFGVVALLSISLTYPIGRIVESGFLLTRDSVFVLCFCGIIFGILSIRQGGWNSLPVFVLSVIISSTPVIIFNEDDPALIRRTLFLLCILILFGLGAGYWIWLLVPYLMFPITSEYMGEKRHSFFTFDE